MIITKSFKITDIADEEYIKKGNKGYIIGVLSKGDIIDRDNEIISSDALLKAYNNQKNDDIPFLYQHNDKKALGVIELNQAKMENDSLIIKADFSNTSFANDIYKKVQNNEYQFLSIGAMSIKKNLKSIDNKPITVYNEIIIKEGSLVKNPANLGAKIIEKSFNDLSNIENKEQLYNFITKSFGYDDIEKEYLDNIFNIYENIIKKENTLLVNNDVKNNVSPYKTALNEIYNSLKNCK